VSYTTARAPVSRDRLPSMDLLVAHRRWRVRLGAVPVPPSLRAHRIKAQDDQQIEDGGSESGETLTGGPCDGDGI
jgi:hypothetical protein